MLLPALIAVYGAFSRKSKPKDGGELTSAQKTNNFIRDNAGKLSFVATIPMLVEEAAATIKGQKWAKEFLTPDLAKKVLKGNSIAYGSYLLTAASLVFASWTAVKIKDRAIAKKERKLAEKEAQKAQQEEQNNKQVQALISLDTYRSNNDGNANGVELDKGVLDERKKGQGNVGTHRS